MKNTILLLLCVTFGGVQAQNLTEKDVPAPVRQGFVSKFPSVKKVKWSKENLTEFEAEFKTNGKEMSCNFDETGKWLITETEIKTSELPAAVISVIQKEYAGYTIEEAERAEKSTQEIVFEVEIEKGKSSVELQVSSDGKIISRQESK